MSRLLLALSCALVVLSGLSGPAHATLPYDHIVIVVEENRSHNQIIGNPDAPYLNEIATGGLSFTNFYAITHPSQPNYIHLFSGTNQGVTTDSLPAGTPFTTGNLGASLIAAGKTFAGYSESMPSVGYLGETFTTVAGQNQYVRKHNPWVNWQANSPTPNQLLPTTNQPFTAFPSDFSTLPVVSFVIPNEQNDMHDGTIAQADAWLQTNIKPYADWAKNNNSLLIVTWDEDESASRNKIPTIFYGANVVNGVNDQTWTLHNLKRTLEDSYATTHSGASVNVPAIVGAFASDPGTITRTFQQGLDGYTQAADTFLDSALSNTPRSADEILVTDGAPVRQALVRFDGIIGAAANQVPQGATILSAKLSLLTRPDSDGNDPLSTNTIALHRMVRSWTDADTYDSLNEGVSIDNLEALAASDFSLIPNVDDAWAIFDVTSGVQEWVSGTQTNEGWLLRNVSGGDAWRFRSSETDIASGGRPLLEITYAAFPWQNFRHRIDIDNNRFIEPRDVLLLIDDINRNGIRALPPPVAEPPPYLDPTGDNNIFPGDILAVIDWINRNGIGGTAGLSEATSEGNFQTLGFERQARGLSAFQEMQTVPEPGTSAALSLMLLIIWASKRSRRRVFAL